MNRKICSAAIKHGTWSLIYCELCRNRRNKDKCPNFIKVMKGE